MSGSSRGPLNPDPPAVTGADGELIERFLELLGRPPVPEPGTDWTSDVFLALLHNLDLLDAEDWYDPRTNPDLALGQLRERALRACEEPDDPVGEDELVGNLLGAVDGIVDGWASDRADDTFGSYRDAATKALTDRDELRRMLERFNRHNPNLYRGMAEHEFAAELRRQIRDAPFMRPRSVEVVAALVRLQAGWHAAKGALLGPEVVAEWRSRRGP